MSFNFNWKKINFDPRCAPVLRPEVEHVVCPDGLVLQTRRTISGQWRDHADEKKVIGREWREMRHELIDHLVEKLGDRYGEAMTRIARWQQRTWEEETIGSRLGHCEPDLWLELHVVIRPEYVRPPR